MICAQFIESARGPIFVLARIPEGKVNGCVLILPPFAEEMNKTRPMFTRLGNLLAVNGIASVLLDLYGTGDSGGDFSDATWSVWQDDVAQAIKWCELKRIPVTNLLAVRLGCSLAVEMAHSERLPSLRSTILWQPLFDGRRALTQFLRLRVAASMLSSKGKETVDSLRRLLRAGKSIEIAGYQISSQLAAELDQIVVPSALPDDFGAVTWIELGLYSGANLPSLTASIIDKTIENGGLVKVKIYQNEAFWSSTEITCIDSVIEASCLDLKGTYLSQE